MEYSKENEIKIHIYECLDEYKQYIQRDDKFPQFKIEIDSFLPKTTHGDNNVINAYTNWDHGNITLYVPEKMLKMSYQPILFHEFTHIKDLAKWGIDDYNELIAVKGFSEYNAYQIEALRYNGVEFKDVKTLETFLTCEQYRIDLIQKDIIKKVDDSYDDIKKVLSQNDFPKCLKELDFVLDMLFKYWGLRSAYKMCGGDYEKNIVEEASKKIINIFVDEDINPLKKWDDTLYGFLNDDNIVQLIKEYKETRNFVMERFHFEELM